MRETKIKRLAEQCVKKWKNHLGFSEWRINVEITTFKRADNFQQDGDIVVDYKKKKATVLIGGILKSSVEEIVVHELAHLLLWPLDQDVMLVIKTVKLNNRNKTEENFLDKLEKAVDHLTKSFLRIQK